MIKVFIITMAAWLVTELCDCSLNLHINIQTYIPNICLICMMLITPFKDLEWSLGQTTIYSEYFRCAQCSLHFQLFSLKLHDNMCTIHYIQLYFLVVKMLNISLNYFLVDTVIMITSMMKIIIPIKANSIFFLLALFCNRKVYIQASHQGCTETRQRVAGLNLSRSLSLHSFVHFSLKPLPHPPKHGRIQSINTATRDIHFPF